MKIRKCYTKFVFSFIIMLLKTISSLSIMTAICFGQIINENEIEKLQIKAHSLEIEIKIKTDSLNNLIKKINHLKHQLFLANIANKDGGFSIFAICRTDGMLRRADSPHSEVLTTITRGDTVKLTDYQKGYWIVNKGQYFGYLSDMYIQETEDVKIFKNEIMKQNEELRKMKEAEEAMQLRIAAEKQSTMEKQKQKEYRQDIINKFGKDIGEKLLRGYYWIGMTDDMALISLGKPRSINKSVGPWGIHEQWIYYNIYLYFENGILKIYQNLR